KSRRCREPYVDGPRSGNGRHPEGLMIRVMTIIEPHRHRLSGPAKGVLDFFSQVTHEVSALLVLFERNTNGPTEFREACYRRGLRTEVVRERQRFAPSVVARAVRLVSDFKPDLIQTHGYKPDVLGWLLSSLFQRPWVAYSHGWTEEGAAMRAYRWLDER